MNRDFGNRVRLQAGNWQVLLFAASALFLCRPAMLAGFFNFKLTFFTEGLLVLLAGGLLLFSAGTSPEKRRKILLPPEILCSFAVLGLSGLLHWCFGGFYHPEFLGEGLLFAVLPFFAWYYRESFSRILIPLSLLIWSIQLIVYLVQYVKNGVPFGITGNWNWSAVLFAACAMVSAAAFRTNQGKIRKCFLIPLLLLTLFFLFTKFYSRAVLAALVLTGLMLILLFLRKKRKIVIYSLGGLIAVVLIAALTIFSIRTAELLSREIRTELAGEAVSLIAGHPFGVGSAGYENAVIPYKTDAYFLHRDAAVRTSHPHNELLNMAATLGIPAALAWMTVVLSVLIRFFLEDDRKKHTVQQRLCFTAWFFILICSGADILLHTWPMNWYFPLLTGILIPVCPSEKTVPAFPFAEKCVGIFLIVLAFVFAGFTLTGTWYAQQAKHGGKWPEAVLDHYWLAVPDPEEIYFFAVTSLTKKNDIPLSRKFAAMLQAGPWPDYAHIHRLLANMYAMERKNEKALKEYEKECRCYPYDPDSLYGRMNALGRLGRIAEAEHARTQLSKLLLIRNMDEKKFYRRMQHTAGEKQ